VSYILDTDTCSAHLRKRPDLTSRFIQYGQLYTTTINAGELFTWAYKKPNPNLLLPGIDDLLSELIVLPFDHGSAEVFGQYRGTLLSQGIEVARLDMLIASIALQHNLTLVTHNTKDYVNIPDLRLEDWIV
jgi:tRNA(fMet)-specific endonuclease VapC